VIEFKKDTNKESFPPLITDMDQRYDVVDDADKPDAIRKLEVHRNAEIISVNVDKKCG
jgi:hypothetical protein